MYQTHSKVERVASNDLMRVRGWIHARRNERVCALDGKLRACEAKHVLRRGRLGQDRACDKSVPIHGEEKIY